MERTTLSRRTFSKGLAGMAALEEGSRPSACLSCGKCVRACPQGIDVPAHLRTFAAGLARRSR